MYVALKSRRSILLLVFSSRVKGSTPTTRMDLSSGVTHVDEAELQRTLDAISIITAVHSDDIDSVISILEDLDERTVETLLGSIVILEGVVKFMLEYIREHDDNPEMYRSYEDMLKWLAFSALDDD